MIRFSIKDILWLTAIVGLAISWGGTVEAWRTERSGHEAANLALNAERINSAVQSRQLADTQLRLNRITSAYIQAKHAHEKEQEDLNAAHQQEVERLKFQLAQERRAAQRAFFDQRGLDEPASRRSEATDGQR